MGNRGLREFNPKVHRNEDITKIHRLFDHLRQNDPKYS